MCSFFDMIMGTIQNKGLTILVHALLDTIRQRAYNPTLSFTY